jgi:hypothetical protein
MKFFNIDMHISVIEDLKWIFRDLGHIVDERTLSGAAHILNKSVAYTKVITQQDWCIWGKCDNFYEAYREELKDHDGFICCYPPIFAMLYEKFNKPIIIHCPIRFHCGCMNQDGFDKFIKYLQNGIDNKKIIPVANSKYEKLYLEYYTEREWKHIPNLCEYTGINCYGTGNKFILCDGPDINIPQVVRKSAFGSNYNYKVWDNIKGSIHYPYNVGTMSIFEQYTGNIPLLFPSLNYCLELADQKQTLSQVHWVHEYQSTFPWKKYIKYADFYDEEWMPYITYFNSQEELYDLINTIDTIKISNSMCEFNQIRKERIYKLWSEILQDISNGK